eukprot:1971631-Rhodomonas_salina.2
MKMFNFNFKPAAVIPFKSIIFTTGPGNLISGRKAQFRCIGQPVLRSSTRSSIRYSYHDNTAPLALELRLLIESVATNSIPPSPVGNPVQVLLVLVGIPRTEQGIALKIAPPNPGHGTPDGGLRLGCPVVHCVPRHPTGAYKLEGSNFFSEAPG